MVRMVRMVRGQQSDPPPNRAAVRLAARQPPFPQPSAEALLRLGGLASGLAPSGIGPVKLLGVGLGSLIEDAVLIEERRQHVHIAPILLCRVANGLRRLEALPLPVQAPTHRPGQDPG